MLSRLIARFDAAYWKLRNAVRRRKARIRLERVREAVAAGNALRGKVALVTGAERGIGLAIATAFARAGARCVMLVLDQREGEAAANSLMAEGLAVELRVADVCDDRRLGEIADELHARYGHIDVLVNNAGVQLEEDRNAPASRTNDELLKKTLAVNLYGVIHASKAFAPHIASGGRIINVSSTMGQLSRRYDGFAAAYCLSKTGVNSYTRSLAAELGPRGIMVDCFHPGWVKTVIGGPRAEIEPKDAVPTAFFLATRPASPETGLFWRDCMAIAW